MFSYPGCIFVLATFVHVTWQAEVRNHGNITLAKKHISCCKVTMDTLEKKKTEKKNEKLMATKLGESRENRKKNISVV